MTTEETENGRTLHDARPHVPMVLPAGWRLLYSNSDGYVLQNNFIAILVSFAIERDGKLWKHISVSRRDGRIPTWIDLHDARALTVSPEEHACMIWPCEDEYVNQVTEVGKEVLHMFVPMGHTPLPDFRLGQTPSEYEEGGEKYG